MQIRRATRPDEFDKAADLFDKQVDRAAVERFLSAEGHHLLLAYEHDEPVGFISGVEMTHPDKGTEMFVYELGVAEQRRRQGIGTALLQSLADLSVERRCYGMWVLTEPDNSAALATYRKLRNAEPEPAALLAWRWDE